MNERKISEAQARTIEEIYKEHGENERKIEIMVTPAKIAIVRFDPTSHDLPLYFLVMEEGEFEEAKFV